MNVDFLIITVYQKIYITMISSVFSPPLFFALPALVPNEDKTSLVFIADLQPVQGAKQLYLSSGI